MKIEDILFTVTDWNKMTTKEYPGETGKHFGEL